MGRNLRDEVRRKHLVKFASDGVAARNVEQIFELRIPGFDAILEIDRDNADVQRFDDIFAEIFQTFDLQGFLLEGLVQPGVFDRDRDVSGDCVQKLEVLAGEIIAIYGLAQAQIQPRFDRGSGKE